MQAQLELFGTMRECDYCKQEHGEEQMVKQEVHYPYPVGTKLLFFCCEHHQQEYYLLRMRCGGM